MKKLITLSYLIYLLLVPISFANSQNCEQNEAVDVVKVFLNALIGGDTQTIRESLGGDLLNKRKKLLDNPNYAMFLEDTYGDARFEINDCKRINMGRIMVSATVFLKNNETRKMEFLLIRETTNIGQNTRYLIYKQITN